MKPYLIIQSLHRLITSATAHNNHQGQSHELQHFRSGHRLPFLRLPHSLSSTSFPGCICAGTIHASSVQRCCELRGCEAAMLGLPEGNDESTWTRTARRSRKAVRKVNKAVMRSHHFHIPKYDLPLRLRPVSPSLCLTSSRTLTTEQWFLVFTCLILLSLAFLGFTNFSHSLPLNDKLLHFLCLGLATGVFYFIFDVEE